LQDHLKNWRKSTLIITSILFLAAIIWGIGIFMNSVDRSNEVSEDDEVEEDKLESKTENSTLA
jgi:Na+-transporting methylmalonyl-CoA/oxaloacetate decarboxylase gamma subunit